MRAGGDPGDAATWPIQWELRSSDNGPLFQFLQDVVAGRPLDWSFSPQVFVFPELPISAIAFLVAGGSIYTYYLLVAVLNNAPYEFEAHVPHAKAAGVAESTIEAMRQVPLAADAPLSPAQAVAVRLADAMTRDIVVPDALYAQVRSHFASPQQQLDLVATVAAYNMVSRLLVALQVGH